MKLKKCPYCGCEAMEQKTEMNREKQIEELVDLLLNIDIPTNDGRTNHMNCEEATTVACALQSAGYWPRSVVAQIFEEIEKIIDDKYNLFVFKARPYDEDTEIEAIINYSDSVSNEIDELKQKYIEGGAE